MSRSSWLFFDYRDDRRKNMSATLADKMYERIMNSGDRDRYIIDNISTVASIMKWTITVGDAKRADSWFVLVPWCIIAEVLTTDEVNSVPTFCNAYATPRAVLERDYECLSEQLSKLHGTPTTAINIALAYRDHRALDALRVHGVYRVIEMLAVAIANWTTPPDDATIMTCVSRYCIDHPDSNEWSSDYRRTCMLVVAIVDKCSSRVIDHCLKWRDPSARLRRIILHSLAWYSNADTWKGAIYLLSIGLPIDEDTLKAIARGGQMCVAITHAGMKHVDVKMDIEWLINQAGRNKRMAAAIASCPIQKGWVIAMSDVHRAYTMSACIINRTAFIDATVVHE